MGSEIRIRVKPNVKEMLEANKEKYGFSINFQVNFAIFKYLILDSRIPYWKLDTRPDPHYEDINKLPEDIKFEYNHNKGYAGEPDPYPPDEGVSD